MLSAGTAGALGTLDMLSGGTVGALGTLDMLSGGTVGALGTLDMLSAGTVGALGTLDMLSAGVIDSNEPDAWEVVVNKGTEYVLPDAPDILLIYYSYYFTTNFL